MVSEVKSRPNHYAVLGLAPTASGAEIAEAFAARMGLFGARPWAAAAQMSLAFETLRDPAKRRAYDATLGLNREPRPQPRGWKIAPPQRSAVTFARVAVDEPKSVAPPPPPKVQPPLPEARVEPEPLAAWDAAKFEEREPERSTELKRAAFVVGALILVAGGVGIAAGLSAGGEADDQAGVTVPLPGAKPKAEVAAASRAPVATPVEEPTEQPAPAEAVEASAKRASPPARIASVEPQPSERIESIASALVENQPVVTDAAVEAPAPETAAVDLPLPKKVIVRTIDRIGFTCGSVASASAVDGAPGVYKINCSSGQSYRAAPVRGRYHFRRWSGD